MAKILVEDLPEKWNPRKNTPYKDNLDHTKNRKEKYNRTIKRDKNIYNPDITEKQNPENAIRIFTENKITEEETNATPRYRKHNNTGKNWIVYTDGSCKNGNTKEAKAGIGIYCENENEITQATKLQGTKQTNQRAELMAILITLTKIPKGDKLTIKTDSMYAINRIIEGIKKWEDIGWLQIDNEDLFKKIAYELDIRGEETILEWTKGHSGIEGNEKADKLANEGTEKEITEEINLKVPKGKRLEGA
jgi:ribonuclease HI